MPSSRQIRDKSSHLARYTSQKEATMRGQKAWPCLQYTKPDAKPPKEGRGQSPSGGRKPEQAFIKSSWTHPAINESRGGGSSARAKGQVLGRKLPCEGKGTSPSNSRRLSMYSARAKFSRSVLFICMTSQLVKQHIRNVLSAQSLARASGSKTWPSPSLQPLVRALFSHWWWACQSDSVKG